MTLKAKAMKTEINKWDNTKVKSFCIAKERINKTKKFGEAIFGGDFQIGTK